MKNVLCVVALGAVLGLCGCTHTLENKADAIAVDLDVMLTQMKNMQTDIGIARDQAKLANDRLDVIEKKYTK